MQIELPCTLGVGLLGFEEGQDDVRELLIGAVIVVVAW
jgi:hypothetical protein